MIYCDENVWIPVVEGLRRRGWEVTTARAEGLLGEPDETHLRYAAERDWIVLTFDDDFLSLVETRLSEIEHAGVVYASQHGHDVGALVRRIDALLQRVDATTLQNETWFA